MKLWKDNRIDQGYELSTDQLADKFLASTYANEPMPLDRSLSLYIAYELTSSWDPDETEERDDFDQVVDAIIAKRREAS